MACFYIAGNTPAVDTDRLNKYDTDGVITGAHSRRTRFVSGGSAVDSLTGRCCRVRRTVSSAIGGKSNVGWFSGRGGASGISSCGEADVHCSAKKLAKRVALSRSVVAVCSAAHSFGMASRGVVSLARIDRSGSYQIVKAIAMRWPRTQASRSRSCIFALRVGLSCWRVGFFPDRSINTVFRSKVLTGCCNATQGRAAQSCR